MEEKNKLPKKITFFDKMKNTIRNIFGYKDGKRFTLDVEPFLKKYSYIELLNLANIETKLRNVLLKNKDNEKPIYGIKEEEAEEILEWVVQNAREQLDKKKGSIRDNDLFGCCGLGQGITGHTLCNMGLSPNILNANSVFSEGAKHAFLTVEIPVMTEEGKPENKLYLVDTTYRQFFLREGFNNPDTEFVKDKKYGNRVAPVEGYWALQLDGGKEFATELLSKGYIELTEKNAKIYGDSFVLANKPRKGNTRVPNKKELQTRITGEQFIRNMTNKQLEDEIDYTREEMNQRGINIKTPLMLNKYEERNTKGDFTNEENRNSIRDESRDI